MEKHRPAPGQYGEGASRRTQRETRLGPPHPSPPPRAKASHHGTASLPGTLGAAPGSCQGRFGSTLVPSKRPSPLLGDRKFLEQVGRMPQICSQRLWNRPFHGKGQEPGSLPIPRLGSSVSVQNEILPQPQWEDPRRGCGIYPSPTLSLDHGRSSPPHPQPLRTTDHPQGPRSRKRLEPEKIFYPVQKKSSYTSRPRGWDLNRGSRGHLVTTARGAGWSQGPGPLHPQPQCCAGVHLAQRLFWSKQEGLIVTRCCSRPVSGTLPLQEGGR